MATVSTMQPPVVEWARLWARFWARFWDTNVWYIVIEEDLPRR
jgi:hypothetical protein